jgi:hypothetical protein
MAEEQRQPGIAESILLNAIRENAIEIFLVAPTLPVTVFLRRNVGFRVLKPWVIYLAFIIVNTAGWIALAGGGLMQSGATEGMIFFVANLAFLALSIFWRYTAWNIIRRGDLWHTKSRGVSYLSFLPLRDDKIQRFVEPAICFVLGLVLLPVFKILAAWLIFSGLGLLVLEQLIYDWQLNMMLDQYDGIIDAQVAGQTAEIFSGQSSDKTPLTITEACGVSVVVAPELHEMIAKRRAEKAARAAAAPVAPQPGQAIPAPAAVPASVGGSALNPPQPLPTADADPPDDSASAV